MIASMGRSNKNPSPSRAASLAEDVARLSRFLTKDRNSLPAAYLRDPGLRKAYLAYFLPPNLAKMAIPLHELDLHPGKLFAKTRLQVLDLGSGPGTAVLGVRQYFAMSRRPIGLDFTAVDQVAENLREAEVLFREEGAGASPSATLTTVRSNIEALAEHAGGPFDIIVLSNVLNELYLRDQDRVARRIALVSRIVERLLAPEGSCIIVEPALRETSRELLMVRDGLVDGGIAVYSPCLVQGSCPALENPKDWCHEDRPWEAPETIKEIDSRVGLRKDSLKFSYLVLRKDGRTLADACTEHSYRVVSEPLISKGKRELFLCGREGRRIAARLDKDAVPGNKAFDSLLRGDVVNFSGLVIEEKRFMITKDTQVSPLPVFRVQTPKRTGP
jgi:ribosomal protein RSM22 (predicted rRNA methylase)